MHDLSHSNIVVYTIQEWPYIKLLLNIWQAYKNVRKIIKLVKLLGSLQDGAYNEEPAILSIIADYAMKASDFDACLAITDILMVSKPASSAACKVCAQLVANENFENVEAKARLSSFCITYCSDELIGNTL